MDTQCRSARGSRAMPRKGIKNMTLPSELLPLWAMQASRLRSDIELPVLPEGCAPRRLCSQKAALSEGCALSEDTVNLPPREPSLFNCEGLTFRDLMRLHGLADGNRTK